MAFPAELTVKNYRCFGSSRPLRLELSPGFTALVGSNNAGKSTGLRFFYEFRDLFQQLNTPNNLRSHLISMQGQRGCVFQVSVSFHLSVGDDDETRVFNDQTLQPIELEMRFPGSDDRLVLTIPRERADQHVTVERKAIGTLTLMNRPWPADVLWQGENILKELGPFAELLNACQEAMYVGSYRNALSIGAPRPADSFGQRMQNYYDLDVGMAFIRAWRHFKGGTKEEMERAARVEEAIGDLFGYDSLQINASKDDTTLDLLIDGKGRKLYEVGSGLSQFILVLAHAAMRQPAFVLVDEPELSLHPPLQVRFLESLSTLSRYGVLFATHSMGLARSIGAKVYLLRRPNNGVSDMQLWDDMPRLSEVVGELSFSAYRELGFDRLLLAEGTTDTPTLRHFLRLYKKDHQVVVLPMGGTALVKPDVDEELEEIKRICPRVSALIDSDKKCATHPLSQTKSGFAEACKRAGVPCHILDRRSIEHYLADAAVKRVCGETHSGLGPFEELANQWAKSDNRKIAEAMTVTDLEGTDLGEFLRNL